jgi:hypothetical protein
MDSFAILDLDPDPHSQCVFGSGSSRQKPMRAQTHSTDTLRVTFLFQNRKEYVF